LLPADYAVLTGASAQVAGVVALMAVGALIVVLLNRHADRRPIDTKLGAEKE
jgi:putative membrane protein